MAATMNLFAAVHADVVGAEIVERAEDATHACVTPAILARRLDELASPTVVTVAGAPLLTWLADTTEVAGHEVRHYYGAAELSFVAAGRDAETLTGFPGVRIEIRAGEIWVCSPYLAQRRAERVLEGSPGQPLQPSTDRLRRDGDWATVGDLGSWEHGRLVVTGRPDTVLTAGVTVVLAEVERALGAGTTRPMACFGVDRPSVGQVLAAVVTEPTDVATLQRLARETLSAGHRPRLWFVADELPLTGTGKVDRRVLAELAAAGGLLRG